MNPVRKTPRRDGGHLLNSWKRTTRTHTALTKTYRRWKVPKQRRVAAGFSFALPGRRAILDALSAQAADWRGSSAMQIKCPHCGRVLTVPDDASVGLAGVDTNPRGLLLGYRPTEAVLP
jgi:hypothetical protein